MCSLRQCSKQLGRRYLTGVAASERLCCAGTDASAGSAALFLAEACPLYCELLQSIDIVDIDSTPLSTPLSLVRVRTVHAARPANKDSDANV
jgi:hypothetical protein